VRSARNPATAWLNSLMSPWMSARLFCPSQVFLAAPHFAIFRAPPAGPPGYSPARVPLDGLARTFSEQMKRVCIQRHTERLPSEDRAMSLRTGGYVLVYILTGAALIVFACLGAMLILADNNNCGAAFGYYGCETPEARKTALAVFFCSAWQTWRQIFWLLIAAAAKGYDVRTYGRSVSFVAASEVGA
jgi:hypothetical protein